MMTLGSLFDGLGGWQIAACRAGIKPMWSSEIEKFPLKLTSIRFPQTKQLGDVTKMSAGEIKPVDIITMGSPCQDLSLAGKRKGLAGERSGLFVTAVELVHSMRKITNGKYPKYAVWENVTGAFSSNKGMDFKSVLEAFTKTSIPVPRHGKWAKSGMVRSRICTVIWRTLDAQYWGVPQRRRRIFLVADYTGGGGTEEILFKPEMLSRHLDKSKEAQCQVERNSGGCLEETGEFVLNDQGGEIIRESLGMTGTLTASVHQPIVFDITHACNVIRTNVDICQSLTHHMGTGGNNVPITYDNGNVTLYQKDGKIGSLMARDYKGVGNDYLALGDVIISALKLRKLTPLEYERLQGLPDNWTLINDKTCSDSARYKAIGNGMAQPCADFIIKRIVEHEESKVQ